ncbi:hypothetical protein HXX76_011944 [Chlamydomonas incerta]|uniref:Endonuclease/exonuclease/phosphatase domain-containing protein n=1 Tax=Chlamydomonas incerta TaxID=51695 RepID=A0A835SIT6_CHLIN|nr:hypothetical protein HXX76_011944 [Chlamydomonas incerta]|eukprot:KAG2427957.1 hypothetical protein HXX76_011944 [Chlamydomonas incerta]
MLWLAVLAALVASAAAQQVAISNVQGTRYRSTFTTRVSVEGIVVAQWSNLYALMAPTPDANAATSEGILVVSPTSAMSVGDRVRVNGTVSESRPGGDAENMVTTRLGNNPVVWQRLSSGNPLPQVVIGCDGGDGVRSPPVTKIEDAVGDVEQTTGETMCNAVACPSLTVLLNPAVNALAFYESLEGSRVLIKRPVVVGPTNNFGETPVVASRADGTLCALASQLTPRGGLIIDEVAGIYNPSRMLLDDTILNYLPGGKPLQVGDVLGDIIAIVDYSFGNYKFYATQLATLATPSPLTPTPSLPLPPTPGLAITIASLNVENLSPADPASKFARIAAAVVTGLRSPDLLGVAEIQDNSGPTDDLVVDAAITITTLLAAIRDAGGPAYAYLQINPENNQDGGQPGGNIRQILLYNPAVASAFSLPAACPSTPNAVVADANGKPQLRYSPGRLEPSNIAFQSSRKPLAVQLVANGQPLFVIVNHFNSKGGDQPLFGRNQPPARSSEVQRGQQAAVVASYVKQILDLDAQARVVVMGDLNDFAGSAALGVLYGAGLTNAYLLPEAAGLQRTPPNQRYSYNFEGNAQALDHILLSASLAPGAEVGVLHVNSEFAEGAAGSTRFSDHDPLLVRLPALAMPVTPINQVQGSAYVSSLAGSRVTVEGVVVARRSNQFWMVETTSPDAVDATSEGLLVFTGSNPPVPVAVGDRVRVTGTVSEFRPGNDPTNMVTTQISGSPYVTRLSTSPVALPPAAVIGCEPGMLSPPLSKIDDAVGNVEQPTVLLNPAVNALAFYESLEGSRVLIKRPVVVGPTNDFGETPVVASRADGTLCALASQLTPRGGLIIDEVAGIYNPSRMLLDDTILNYLPGGKPLQVGDVLGDIIAIVDYSFGNYKFYATQLATLATPSPLTPTPSLPLPPTPGLAITIASLNVENLSPADPASKFARIAAAVVTGLRSPDLLGVAEVQDNDGPVNTTVVAADVTLGKLITAIQAAGGPAYAYLQINPEDDKDGGQPGGNIRQVLLYNPAIVAPANLPAGDSATANAVIRTADGQPQLKYSPGRLDPTNPAFTSSRKPLALQLSVNGQPLFVITNHFNSKGGDQPLFGRNQPPARSSEVQRAQQAAIVAGFVSQILAIEEQSRVVVMGDLNDFAGSAALAVLYGAGLTNAYLLPEAAGLQRTPPNQRYSYNFEGNAQALDHILLSASLAPGAEVGVLHVNSEFAEGGAGSTRFSDHDPLLVRVAGVNSCMLKPNPCPNPTEPTGSVCVNAPGTARGYDCLCRPGFAPKSDASAGTNAQSCKPIAA